MSTLRHLAFGVIVLCSLHSSARGSPFCPADINSDSNLNFYDVSRFVEQFIGNNLDADLNHDGSLNFFDISAFLISYLDGCPDLTDTDGDRIPDFAETDDGRYFGYQRVGTNPLNPDTDGDGILDGDELLGTVDGLDLPTLGADPLRRDIFVECDWFAGDFNGFEVSHRPSDEVIDRVVDAFAIAPVENPYGADPGVQIHFDYGQGGVFNGGNQLPGNPIFILFDFEFNILKEQFLDENRRAYFHYAIFAHRYNTSTNNSSGVGELNGNDFMVTLSTYGTPTIMANTIMHELGHNLGLRHGGFEELNWKPNYNSVMNYRYQFGGVDLDGDAMGDGLPDYSIGLLAMLDESRLVEFEGIDGVTPIDWDGDGAIETNSYAGNINCEFGIRSCGNGSNCWDSVCSNLRDFDDWGSINWDRLTGSIDRQPKREIIECRGPISP